MTLTVKYVRDNDFIEFVSNEDGTKVTASDPSIIALWNSFVERENNDEWVEGVGDFFADVDGLEGEAGFTRVVTK